MMTLLSMYNAMSPGGFSPGGFIAMDCQDASKVLPAFRSCSGPVYGCFAEIAQKTTFP